MKPTKSTSKYIISVEYNLAKEGFGLDDILNKIAGQKSGSSGCMIAEKIRDIQWYFSDKKKAEAVFKKMQAKGVEVTIRKDDEL